MLSKLSFKKIESYTLEADKVISKLEKLLFSQKEHSYSLIIYRLLEKILSLSKNIENRFSMDLIFYLAQNQAIELGMFPKIYRTLFISVIELNEF